MTDVIFTRTYLSAKEMYGSLSFAGASEPSLGICYLAAVARRAGHAVEIIDSIPLKIGNDELARLIVGKKPKYVGLSAVTLTIHRTAELAAMIKSLDRSIVTIIGGVHVTAIPRETMAAFPDLDIAVLGEGEETIVDLLEALEKKRDLAGVAGIAFRDGGGIRVTDRRMYIKDLDTLPMPAWDLLPELKSHYKAPAWTLNFEPSGLLILTRGCTANCIYCDRGAFGSAVRAHSADYAMRLIRNLYHDHGIKVFRILDDNFMLNRARLSALCNAIIKEGLDIQWTCFARADHVTEDMLALMHSAGCRQMSFGIETGSQELHDLEKKNISLATIERGVRWAKKAGIMTVGFTMIGHPGETPATARQTIEFCKTLDLDDFKMVHLTPYPGTQIYKEIDKYGTLDGDFRKMNAYTRPCFVPFTMTQQELVDWRKRAYRMFYLRPKAIRAHLMALRKPRQWLVFFRGVLALLKMWTVEK